MHCITLRFNPLTLCHCISISRAEMSLQSHWIAPNCNSSGPFCPFPRWNLPLDRKARKVKSGKCHFLIEFSLHFRFDGCPLQSYRNNLITGNQESVSPSKVFPFLYFVGHVKIFCWNVFKFLLVCFLVFYHATLHRRLHEKPLTLHRRIWFLAPFLHSRFLHFFMMIKSYLNVSYVYDNVVPVVAFWRKLPEIEKILWNGKVSPKSFSLGNEMFILNGFNCV